MNNNLVLVSLQTSLMSIMGKLAGKEGLWLWLLALVTGDSCQMRRKTFHMTHDTCVILKLGLCVHAIIRLLWVCLIDSITQLVTDQHCNKSKKYSYLKIFVRFLPQIYSAYLHLIQRIFFYILR